MGRPYTPLEERFRQYFTEGAETECWEWQGARDRDGYGQTSDRGRSLKAHRVAFELNVRKLSDDELALHTCDNPPCVNWHHLYAGTHKDNMEDSARKGRRSGERNSGAKLTNKHRQQMRDMYATGKYTYEILGELFDLSKAQAHVVVTGKHYKRSR